MQFNKDKTNIYRFTSKNMTGTEPYMPGSQKGGYFYGIKKKKKVNHPWWGVTDIFRFIDFYIFFK
jgi:hypothetical protein